jgi:ParB/RepB/Spo0J family partition protein
MSDHTTTQPQGEPTAEFAQLGPTILLTGHNIRQVRADDAFRQLVASIREHGVLVPIVATRDHQGVRVRYGHRRALAAVQAGRASVPVVVYTGTLTDATTAEIDRILGRHAENTHREGLTTGETIAAFGQLAALGQTPDRIARRSKTPRKTVDDALAAAGSEVAAKAARAVGLPHPRRRRLPGRVRRRPPRDQGPGDRRQGRGGHRPRRPAAPRPARHHPRHRGLAPGAEQVPPASPPSDRTSLRGAGLHITGLAHGRPPGPPNRLRLCSIVAEPAEGRSRPGRLRVGALPAQILDAASLGHQCHDKRASCRSCAGHSWVSTPEDKREWHVCSRSELSARSRWRR